MLPWTTLLLYCAVFCVTGTSLTYLLKLRSLPAYRALTLALLAHCLVAAAAIAVYVAGDLDQKIFFSRMRYLGLSLMGPCITIFVDFHYLKSRWLQKKMAIILLFLPGSVAWISNLIPAFQDKFITHFAIVPIGIFEVISFKQGPWFAPYFLGSYLITILGMSISIVALKRAQGAKKNQLWIITFSWVVASAVDILCTSEGGLWRWSMFAGAFYVVTNVGILYAGLQHRLFEVVPYAKEKIFQLMPEPILILSDAQTVETANQSALELFAIEPHDLGRNVSVFYQPQSPDVTHFTKNGRHFDVVKETIRGQGDVTLGSILFFKEVTARIKNEQDLQSHLQFKSVMLSMISHDISGNLSAQAKLMRNFSDYKETVPLAPAIDAIITSHESTQQFLRNVLHWEKSQNDTFTLNRAPFDLRLFVKICSESVSLMSKAKNVRIEETFDSLSETVILADSEILGTMLRNLLTNAIKASFEGGTVTIVTRYSENKLSVEVRDQGPGLNPERLRLLRERSDTKPMFVQNSPEGFGLGLFFVSFFAKVHQGDFWIDSQEGVGTRAGFAVECPK